MEDVNTRTTNFSRRRLKQREFILIVTFSLPSPSSLLKLPIMSSIKRTLRIMFDIQTASLSLILQLLTWQN